jgi:hypothetical protein
MVDNVELWLRQIPNADDALIRLRGKLVACSPSEVSLIVTQVLLSFAPEDVVQVTLLEGGDVPGKATLLLRNGAMLLAAERSDAMAETVRRPFALCVRPRVIRSDAAPRFRETERRFLAKHGIVI